MRPAAARVVVLDEGHAAHSRHPVLDEDEFGIRDEHL
jgi:hypothetical protein